VIWSGRERKRLRSAVHKYPESGLECLKRTKKLTNNTSSNQHWKFFTSRVWIKLWKIRHWNWEDAVCFAMFQLASGNIITDTVNSYFAGLTNSLSSTTTSVSSAYAQFNTTVNTATQNIQSTVQSSTQSIKDYANSAIAATPQAQTQIQNCLNQGTQSLATLGSNTSK
jgi:hypothetical protein